MQLDRTRLELLGPAVDALRRALGRIDLDDVPAALRTVAASSARRLPPPLLRRAVDELEASGWLRAETLAGWDAPDDAGELFLARPPGWSRRLDALVAEAGDRRRARDASRTEQRLAEALAQIAVLESRLEDVSGEVGAAEDRARSQLASRVESAERARRRAEDQARLYARRFAEADARAQQLAVELDVSDRRLASVRQMLERERRAVATPPGEEGARRGWFPSDPLAMAAELDRIVRGTRRRRVEASRSSPGAPDKRRRLPEGIRPDRLEAVRWLMARPFTWLVDGYNLAFALDDRPDAATRSRLVAATGQLVSLASPGTMGVVVFDSSLDTSSMVADRRVRVVFAPSADEWILGQAGDGTVAVSSDRRVREGAEDAGAIGVWAQALAEWIVDPSI